MRLIIDIDDTICCTNRTMDYANAQPYDQRIDRINQLYHDGHEIIYWTSRGVGSGQDWSVKTKHQLDTWNVLYHDVWFGKPIYDLWIDDKAIHADDILDDILHITPP